MLIKAEQSKERIQSEANTGNWVRRTATYKNIVHTNTFWNEELLGFERNVCESFFIVSTNPVYLSASRLWAKKLMHTSNHKSSNCSIILMNTHWARVAILAMLSRQEQRKSEFQEHFCVSTASKHKSAFPWHYNVALYKNRLYTFHLLK